MNRDNAVTKVEPTLQLFLKTHGQDGRCTAERGQNARRFARFAVGDDARNTQTACRLDGRVSQKFFLTAIGCKRNLQAF